MTIEADLRSLLVTAIGADVGNRIHYFRAPQTTEGLAPPMPFVVYTMTGRERVSDLGGTTDRAMSTFQIDVCAESFKAARTLATAIRASLVAWDVPDGALHVEEEDYLDEAVDPAVPRVTQVWEIFHVEA